MWDHVVRHVVDEMEVVDTELAKLNLSYLDCKSATMFYTAGPPQNTANGSNGPAAATAATAAPAASANALGWGAASVAAPRLPSAFASANAQPQQPQLPISLQDLEARYGKVNLKGAWISFGLDKNLCTSFFCH